MRTIVFRKQKVEVPEPQEAAKAIKEAILANPEQLDMANFHKASKCGTVHCIGGWGSKLFNPLCNESEEVINNWVDGPAEFTDFLLNLGTTNLFYIDRWPESFSREYSYATSAAEKAEIACRVIDYFMEISE